MKLLQKPKNFFIKNIIKGFPFWESFFYFKNVLRIAIILLCLFSVVIKTHGNNFDAYTNNCVSAHHHIFNLQFEKATHFLEKEKIENPDNLLILRLNNYIDFLKAFISEEQSHHETLQKNTKKRLDFLSSNQLNSPLNKMIEGEIILMLSISEFKSKEFLSAAWDLRKAYKLLSQNRENYPELIENNLGLGLLHAIIGATPERYKWIMNMAGMNGDLQTGMLELKEVSYYALKNNLETLNEEANVVSLLTELHINKNTDNANNIISQLNTKKQKTIILFTLSHYYLNTGQTSLAFELLHSEDFSYDRFPFLYLYFMRGIAGLNQLDLSESTYIDLNYFVTNFNGSNFIKAAYQKMAWHKLLNGDIEAYHKLLKKCLNNGNDFTDEDKQAIIEAKRDEVPDINILKARVLFDGGFFKRAKEILEKENINNFQAFKTQVEYNYRLARTLDELNEDENANALYLKTIETGENETWYYAANSSYHLARYYEEMNDLVNAKKYYTKCLNMNNTEYKNSIRQKAKTGLNRIKNK